jgi:hypothetical protein
MKVWNFRFKTFDLKLTPLVNYGVIKENEEKQINAYRISTNLLVEETLQPLK